MGKYVQHNRETAKIGIRTPLKLYVYFRFVSETTDHISEVLWKMAKNCVRNRTRPDKIDTDTEICTSLQWEFYFRFRWPPSTKSTLTSYISVWVFVTIRGKICPPQSQNWFIVQCARWPIRRPILGFQGAKFPKIWDSLPRTPMNHSQNSLSLALSSAEKSSTVQTHTNLQTVTDHISTPCLSACVECG